MSTRAYKNAKFNGNTKKNYAYTPEYIAHRFTRGGSLKTAYCDHNYVGDVESTFSLKRSPAVYKGASCEFVYNPPPEAGPAGLALEIIKPEAGPVGINLEVVKPEAGPTGIDLEHMAPVAGPVGVSVDNLNPSAGPTDLSLEHLKPQAGPVGIDVTAIKPQAGPIGIDLELLAPSAGPTGIDPTIAHPQAGPTGINISEVKPQTGPIGLDLEILKPASGPTGVSLDIVGPATGPTGLGLTSSPTAVPEDPVSTSFSSFSWTPAEHAVSYSIEYIPWGIDQFICPNFLQEPFSSTVGINEPAEVSGITGNAIDGITWGTDISHPGSMPFRAARIVAVFKSGYRTYGDTFMVFQDVTQEIGGDYPGGAGLEVGSDSDVWTQDFITSLAFVDWQPAGTNVWKLRGTINSDLVRQVRVFNSMDKSFGEFTGELMHTFEGNGVSVVEEHTFNQSFPPVWAHVIDLQFTPREYLDYFWQHRPEVKTINSDSCGESVPVVITDDIKNLVRDGLLVDLDTKSINIDGNAQRPDLTQHMVLPGSA